MREQHGVAIGRRFGHKGRGDHAVGARARLDHYPLTPGRSELLGQRAGEDVDIATRCGGRDDFDGAVGKSILRQRGGQQGKNSGRHSGQRADCPHS